MDPAELFEQKLRGFLGQGDDMSGRNDFNTKRVQEIIDSVIFSSIAADINELYSGILTLYVRPNGSDNGDGSIGSPYRTLQKALNNVPTVFKNGRVVIDITGTSEKLTSTLLLTAGVGPKAIVSPLYNSNAVGPLGEQLQPAVMIAAVPVQTAGPITVTSVTFDSPYITTARLNFPGQNFTPGEFAGKFLRMGQAGTPHTVDPYLPIIDNGVDWIDLTEIINNGMGDQVFIFDLNATLDISDFPIDISGLNLSIGFYGINFVDTNNTHPVEISAKGTSGIVVENCKTPENSNFLYGSSGILKVRNSFILGNIGCPGGSVDLANVITSNVPGTRLFGGYSFRPDIISLGNTIVLCKNLHSRADFGYIGSEQFKTSLFLEHCKINDITTETYLLNDIRIEQCIISSGISISGGCRLTVSTIEIPSIVVDKNASLFSYLIIGACTLTVEGVANVLDAVNGTFDHSVASHGTIAYGEHQV